MKNFTILLFALVMSFAMQAQVPQGVDYQAIVAKADGSPLANTNLGFRISIYQNTTLVYQEEHFPTSNTIGKVNFAIGEGAVISGDFSAINWTNGDYNVDVELDYGSGYQLFGNVDLQSVFYALAAEKAAIADSIVGVDLSNFGDDQTLSLAGTQITIANGNTIDLASILPPGGSDDQMISISNDTIYLEDGGFVTLPNGSSFSGNFNDLNNVPADILDGDNVNDADADATNELQTLSIAGTQITLSDGNTIDLASILPPGGTDDQMISISNDTIYLEDGGFVKLPAGSSFSGDFNDLTNIPADILDGDNVDDADADATNELQTLSLAGTEISLSDGNTIDLASILPPGGSDDQMISISNDTIYLEDGGFAILPSGDGAFENVNGVIRNKNNTGSPDFVFGNDALDGDSTSMILFDQSKGAFRAGYGNVNWQADSMGLYSIALGAYASSKGDYGSAMGLTAQANGIYSTALGRGAKANDRNSIAIGYFSQSNAKFGTAIGTIAEASGEYSTSIGSNTIASGSSSTAIGFFSIAKGFASTAMGDRTKAYGHQSTAMGYNTQANGTGSLAIGRFNDTIVSDEINGTGINNPLFIVGNGNSESNRSNAFVIYEDGRAIINDAYTLPTADGNANQVMTTDGAGNVSWSSAASSGVFENANGVVRNTGNNNTDDFVFGNDAINGAETPHFFFDKSNAAFRVGLGNEYWHADSLGSFSFGTGYLTNASGLISTALGGATTASGYRSTAMGDKTIASGISSTAIGYLSRANGFASTAMGDRTKAYGHQSTALGYNTQANGTGSLAIGRYNDTLVSDAVNESGINNPLFIVGNGEDESTLSNAFVIYEDGRAIINDAYTLPTADGNANQVMTTDGAGNVSWSNAASSGVFENVNGVVRNSGNINTDDFVFGNYAIDGIAASQFIFDKSKSAFRAGTGSPYWHADSLGDFSFGTGYQTKATGSVSTALGDLSTASGYGSTAMGNRTIASVEASTAMGNRTVSSGFASTAMGSRSAASGYASTAMGELTSANDRANTAMGYRTATNGFASTAMGDQTKAFGHQSTAMGFKTQANGTGSLAIGRYNDPLVTDAINETGINNPLFIVGNGINETARSNAFVIYEDGRAIINGAYTLPVVDGSNTQVLTTNGNGQLYWADNTLRIAGKVNEDGNKSMQQDGAPFNSTKTDDYYTITFDANSEIDLFNAAINISLESEDLSPKFEVFKVIDAKTLSVKIWNLDGTPNTTTAFSFHITEQTKSVEQTTSK